MRIKNLEFRRATYLREEPEHCGYNIDYWQPNEYYGRKSEFIKDGDFYHPNDEHYKFVSIHKSCFDYPETCFTIGSFNWNDDCYEFSFIGDRPLRLTQEEWNDFRTLIDYGFTTLNDE